jgi:outer membrane lipoprotein-sorting protein
MEFKMLSLPKLLARRYTLAMATAVLFAVPNAAVFAQDVVQKGYDIAAKSDASDRGFGDSEATLTMVLRNKSGQKSTREMQLLTLERPDKPSLGDKTISVFLSPADIKGTALLSHAKTKANDDQWIFLPATKRVKRISSANKSGPFMGSEFAYEDFAGQELEKYTYKWLKSEGCAGTTCDVVERIPSYKNSGYSRQVVWIDQKALQARKIDFYDRAGAHVKTLVLADYKQVGGVWRAHKLSMQNLRNGKSTDLVFSGFKFKTGLSTGDFKPAAIEGMR